MLKTCRSRHVVQNVTLSHHEKRSKSLVLKMTLVSGMCFMRPSILQLILLPASLKVSAFIIQKLQKVSDLSSRKLKNCQTYHPIVPKNFQTYHPKAVKAIIQKSRRKVNTKIQGRIQHVPDTSVISTRTQ